MACPSRFRSQPGTSGMIFHTIMPKQIPVFGSYEAERLLISVIRLNLAFRKRRSLVVLDEGEDIDIGELFAALQEHELDGKRSALYFSTELANQGGRSCRGATGSQ